MISHSSPSKTRRECRPLLRQALNSATQRNQHSIQQENDKDPGLLDRGKHPAAEQASHSIPATPPVQMPGHGLQIEEHNEDDVIGFGMRRFLSEATATTPSDPRFGAIGLGRRLVNVPQGGIATADGKQQACSEEHVGSDIGSRPTRGEISERTRTEEVRLAVKLVKDSTRQLAELKQSRFGKRRSRMGLGGDGRRR